MSNQIKTMNIMKTYLYTTIAIIATAICMTSNLYAADAPANLKMKSTSALLDPVQALPTQTYQRHTHSKHAIHPSHPLLTSSPLAFNLSQHQGLFQ